MDYYYDSIKMKSGSDDIINELRNYTAAKETIDQIVKDLS